MKALLIGWFLVIGIACGDDLAAAKQKFAKQDEALNQAYVALKKELPAEVFAQVQADQREWVDYRNYLSESQEREGQPETAIERWELAASLTEGRIGWLNAWRKRNEREGWSGSYSDGRGGNLGIVEKDGKVWFRFNVVRGRSFHLGEIAGTLRLNGRLGMFEVKAEGEDDPTWLFFIESGDKGGRVTVEGENTNSFTGARAYFEGDYLWTGPLDAEAQKAVIEGDPDK